MRNTKSKKGTYKFISGKVCKLRSTAIEHDHDKWMDQVGHVCKSSQRNESLPSQQLIYPTCR